MSRDLCVWDKFNGCDWIFFLLRYKTLLCTEDLNLDFHYVIWARGGLGGFFFLLPMMRLFF